MTPLEIKKKVLEFEWELWVERPLGVFSISLFKKGQTRAYMKRFGVDAELPAMLFQNGQWYKSEKVWDIFEKELQKYVNGGGTVSGLVEQCEKYLERGKSEIALLEKSAENPKKKLAELYEILTPVISFIWLVHGLEHLYSKVLRAEVPKYMTGDIEKNIGDLSFPEKKNAHYYLTEALRGKMSLEEVVRKFGWIKARGGFDAGFTVEELALERKRLQAESTADSEFKRPEIPPELRALAKIAQDLVYFRTLRTDVLYELMWVARPVMREIAAAFGLTFDELRDYSALDLMADKVEKFAYHNFSAISWGKEFAMFHEPVLVPKKTETLTMLKGAAAFKGIARGVAKIVKIAHEIDKVGEGDILIAPTTAPSYIIGMQRAAAFVTDEGGITSHAAIVAREMKKPCVIGTKIATKVLKDGDLVEVNANDGTVKIIKKSGKR
jgi:phosphohistidine swiveling domain-containing protein